MHMLFTVSLVCGWLLLSGQNVAQAQVATRTPTSVGKPSADRTSLTRVPIAIPSRDVHCASYMTPSMAESIPTVVYAPVNSSAAPCALDEAPIVPMPTPIVEYSFYAPVSDSAAVPTLTPASPAAIPRDYVVGRNVIGEPKLFRPGQPVRNFLRYISL